MTILKAKESPKMSNKKSKTKTVSDKIHEIIKPKEFPEFDSEDEETSAKFTEFDEVDDVGAKLSDIRKKNIKYLHESDKKYQGKVASRKDFVEDDDSDSESENEAERDIQFASDSEEDSEDGDVNEEGDEESKDEMSTSIPGAFVRLNSSVPESDDDAIDDEDEMDEDDFDLSQNDISLNETNLIQKENTDENIKKGIAVQNQLKVWEKLLEIRIKSQKCLTTANSLPQTSKFDEFYEKEESFKEAADKTIDTVSNVLSNLLELQETLVSKYSETRHLLEPKKKRKRQSNAESSAKRLKTNDFAEQIEANYNSYLDYRNAGIQKWHDRTKVTGNLKNIKNTQNILTKIENSLINKEDLIRKTQIYRGGYSLFEEIEAKTGEGEEAEPCSGEIFDDSDFYHQLLRELIEFKTNTSENPTEITNKLVELQRLRKKMKKKVDTRASKGRKTRYIVHNKMVNFMAPTVEKNWTDESKAELFTSLFGGADSSSATTTAL